MSSQKDLVHSELDKMPWRPNLAAGELTATPAATTVTLAVVSALLPSLKVTYTNDEST